MSETLPSICGPSTLPLYRFMLRAVAAIASYVKEFWEFDVEGWLASWWRHYFKTMAAALAPRRPLMGVTGWMYAVLVSPSLLWLPISPTPVPRRRASTYGTTLWHREIELGAPHNEGVWLSWLEPIQFIYLRHDEYHGHEFRQQLQSTKFSKPETFFTTPKENEKPRGYVETLLTYYFWSYKPH